MARDRSKPKKTIVICSSAAFYEHVNEIASALEKLGYRAVVPQTAKKMKQSGDYDVSSVKTWFDDPKHFVRKQKLAKDHLNEVSEGNAVLIVNDAKPGKPDYIGPNGFMEWGLAYHLGKPVFILNGVSRENMAYEEVYGLSAAVLDGDLAKIRL